MSLSIWQKARRKRRFSYDVVIVGGGLVGCATAYWLQRQRSSLRVALLEARTLGAGASGRNAGFVLQGCQPDYQSDVDDYGEATARRLWNFTRSNRDLLESELRGSAFGWRSDGSLTVAGTTEEKERLRNGLSQLRSAGASVMYLDSEQVGTRLRADGFSGGLYFTTGAAVNPLQLVLHLAEEGGADLHTRLPVEGIEWRSQGAVLHTSEFHVGARRVVLAMGPSLPEVVPDLSKMVRPVRAQMLATEPADEIHIPVPVYSHDGEFYVRQLDDGRVLAGGGRHRHQEAEETPEDATTPAVQATIERYLHTHFPWTQPLAIQQRWSGTMGFSPDGRPVVGRVPSHPKSVFATGFSGHGMGFGFRMGQLLADLVTGTPRPEGFDLFDASRFDDHGYGVSSYDSQSAED